MPRGRPPKPTEVHVEEGTLRPDRHAEVPVVLGGRPKGGLRAPSGVTRSQAQAFRELARNGAAVFDAADRPAVEAAAIVLDLLRVASRELHGGVLVEVERTSRSGDTRVVVEPHPAARLVLAAAAEFRQHAAVLGVGPVARARLGSAGEQGNASDDWEELDELAELRRQRASRGVS